MSASVILNICLSTLPVVNMQVLKLFFVIFKIYNFNFKQISDDVCKDNF